MRRVLLALFGALLMFTGCKEDTDFTYCNKRAYFLYERDRVFQTPVLRNACESMEQFCTITTDGKQFIFTPVTGAPNRTDILQEDRYRGFLLGIGGGLIVGKPSLIEMGRDDAYVVCFDRSCRNCYEDFGITKPLTLQEPSLAYCRSCERTYDLNNQGIVSKGEPGRSLFRYRVSYANNSLVVNNR